MTKCNGYLPDGTITELSRRSQSGVGTYDQLDRASGLCLNAARDNSVTGDGLRIDPVDGSDLRRVAGIAQAILIEQAKEVDIG
ncbi:MAG TPA: hypothetical protein VF920_05345, partial [Dongiaceae bacterium]